MPTALTSLSHGAGCGCELSAAALRPILAALPRPADPRVLVSADTADDAGVVIGPLVGGPAGVISVRAGA